FSVTLNYYVSEIDSLFNGKTVRKFLLSYGSGNNAKRSLLTSVQEKGYDENQNLTTLPPMTFTYLNSFNNFYSPSNAAFTVESQVEQIGDTNGDGMNDVNQLYYDSTMPANNYGRYLIDQNPSIAFGNPKVQAYFAINGSPVTAAETGTRYLDINSDGKADIT